MTILSVKLADSPSARDHGAVIASLPEHLRVWTEGDSSPAITAEDAASALTTDDKGPILVADPTELSPAALKQLLSRNNPVLAFPELAPRLAADPLLANTSQIAWSLIDAVSVCGSGSLRRALFEQLVALRELVGELQDQQLLQHSDRHYVVVANTLAGAPVTLSASVVDDGSQSAVIDLVALEERIEIVLDLRGAAHPASIARFDEAGETRSWPVHQSGQRLAWQDTAQSLTAGKPRWTLERARTDLLTARRLLGPDGA